jgi:integrase
MKGLPHYHILTDRFIDQKWISWTWNQLGGARVVDIRFVQVRKIARYLSKYLTKELLLSAPKGTRRITTARAVKLFPKYISATIKWELLRSSIWFLLKCISMALLCVCFGLRISECLALR